MVLSWLAAILSSVVYSYHISVPFHMVFKSSILLVNMAIGTVILRKRYGPHERLVQVLRCRRAHGNPSTSAMGQRGWRTGTRSRKCFLCSWSRLAS